MVISKLMILLIQKASPRNFLNVLCCLWCVKYYQKIVLKSYRAENYNSAYEFLIFKDNYNILFKYFSSFHLYDKIIYLVIYMHT